MRNRGHDYPARIGPGEEGATLLDHLALRYGHSSRDAWRRRIEAGSVLLDGRPTSPGAVLRRGQRLLWRRPAWDEPEAPPGLSVILHDAHVLVVDKPAGLPTLPGGGFLENTLLARVRGRVPDAVPLHRLGRWTSGLVLFACTAGARRALARDWRERAVRKRYLALASGRPPADRFEVGVPIGRVPYAPLGRLWAAAEGGKPSRSVVEVLARRDDGFLAGVTIDTGRPHQIRIHLAAAGYPLVGDPLYGAGGLPRPDTCARPGDPGYALHAHELDFRHPEHGGIVALTCAPPPGPLRGPEATRGSAAGSSDPAPA